jgi:hypothetical protein
MNNLSTDYNMSLLIAQTRWLERAVLQSVGGHRYMKNAISIDMKSHGRFLWVVSAVCLLGFSGCSSFDAASTKRVHSSLIENMDRHSNPADDEDVVAANRDWYQMIH